MSCYEICFKLKLFRSVVFTSLQFETTITCSKLSSDFMNYKLHQFQSASQRMKLLDGIRTSYIECDEQLFHLQHEYDTLTYCSSQLRKMMTAKAGRYRKADLDDLDDLERQAEVLNTIVTECVRLTKQYEAIEEARKKVRLECMQMCDKCNRLARNAVSLVRLGFLREGKLWLVTRVAFKANWFQVRARDLNQEELEQDDYVQLWQLGVAVGALGATVAATSFFSATRGRLDLLSWAFTCFVFVLSWVSRRQAFTRVDRLGADKHTRTLAFDTLCVVGPILAGSVLLVLAWALSNPDGPATVGSETANLVANYTLLLCIAYALSVFLFSYLAGLFARKWRPAFSKNPHEFASHFVDPSERWGKYQAEEDGFSQYRAQPCFTQSTSAFNDNIALSWLGTKRELEVES